MSDQWTGADRATVQAAYAKTNTKETAAALLALPAEQLVDFLVVFNAYPLMEAALTETLDALRLMYRAWEMLLPCVKNNVVPHRRSRPMPREYLCDFGNCDVRMAGALPVYLRVDEHVSRFCTIAHAVEWLEKRRREFGEVRALPTGSER